MDIPVNINIEIVETGIQVSWDEGDSPGDYYEIWSKPQSGEYSCIGLIVAGIGSFIETMSPIVAKSYKIRAILSGSKSAFRHGFNEYADYCIRPIISSSGEILHVDYIRNNYMFGSKSGYVWRSSNSGLTIEECIVADGRVASSYIFSNGNIYFGTHNNKLWLWRPKESSPVEKHPYNQDGTRYYLHNPVDETYPGIYYKQLMWEEPVYINGKEILMWGSYTLYSSLYYMSGVNPTNVYFSSDNGETIKVAYKFGVGHYDDGTRLGRTSPPGNPVGDPSNSLTCSHVHFCKYDPYSGYWYVSSGECASHLLRGTYNEVTDSFTWENVATNAGKFYRCCGMIFTQDYIYMLSDGVHCGAEWAGVWRCDRGDDLGVYTNFTRVFDLDENNWNLAPSIGHGNTTIAGHINDNVGMTFTKNQGQTWKTIAAVENIYMGGKVKKLMCMCSPNSDNEFLLTPYDFLSEWSYYQKSYLLKLK